MWFKNLKIFRIINEWTPAKDDLERSIFPQTFMPAGSLETQSIGWVSPNNTDKLVYELNGQYLLCLRHQKKLLPGSVVNQVAQERAQQIEHQQGFRPGRKQMREIKELVIDELLPKAFVTHTDTYVWIDVSNKWLVIDTSSDARSDEVIGLLSKVINPFPLAPLYVNNPPSLAMNNWILNSEAPWGFTIDEDAELRSVDEQRSIVKFTRHQVDSDDVRHQIEQGRQCVRLGLTWHERISFVLTDTIHLRKVEPLDVLVEQKNQSLDIGSDAFEVEFTLMTGELVNLLSDLVEALGGEKQI